jgi:hypothetical protein
MAFLKAYFDESDRSSGKGCDIFAVAGVAFTRNKADGMIARWRKMLGPIRCFHMADLAARQGEFKGFSPDQAGALLREAVAIVNQYRLAVVACSCRVSDFESLGRANFRGFSSPYAICAHSCMIQLGHWLKSRGNPARVAYFFEAGQEHAADAEHLMLRANEDGGILKAAYRYRGHAFVEKADAVLLQAGDLVAWEFAKFQDETAHQFKRQARGSYLALADADPSSFLVRHRDKADLQELMYRLLYAAHVPEPEDQ